MIWFTETDSKNDSVHSTNHFAWNKQKRCDIPCLQLFINQLLSRLLILNNHKLSAYSEKLEEAMMTMMMAPSVSAITTTISAAIIWAISSSESTWKSAPIIAISIWRIELLGCFQVLFFYFCWCSHCNGEQCQKNNESNLGFGSERNINSIYSILLLTNLFCAYLVHVEFCFVWLRTFLEHCTTESVWFLDKAYALYTKSSVEFCSPTG